MKHIKIIEKKSTPAISIPPNSRLLTLKEASQYTGLSLWSIREAIWRGLFPVMTFPNGRKMWVDRADIDVFIERHKTTYP